MKDAHIPADEYLQGLQNLDQELDTRYIEGEIRIFEKVAEKYDRQAAILRRQGPGDDELAKTIYRVQMALALASSANARRRIKALSQLREKALAK